MKTSSLKNIPSGSYLLRKEASPVALRSIIFDCDGVLIDSEPLHLSAFKKTLGADGEFLTEEIYKDRYMAMDDKGALTRIHEDLKKPLSQKDLEDLMDKKTKIYQELLRSEGLLPFPAVPELIMALSQRYPLAVASGARRHEVDLALESAGIRPYFEVVITADDVQKGKPDPESYLKVVEALNASGKRTSAIKAAECVVIEDSKEGILSAHTAGMRCIGVSTSHPSFELSKADLVVPNLASLKISQVEDLFNRPMPLQSPSPQSN